MTRPIILEIDNERICTELAEHGKAEIPFHCGFDVWTDDDGQEHWKLLEETKDE